MKTNRAFRSVKIDYRANEFKKSASLRNSWI